MCWMPGHHKDGQMAITFVLFLFVLFMFAAFAVDTGFWYFNHRWAQTQAEAAATAALYSLPNASTAQATTDVDAWLVKNLSDPGQRSCLVYSDSNGDALYDTVRVCVRRQVPGIFSGLSNIPFVWVSAAATARVEMAPSPYAIMAMDPSGCKSLWAHGTPEVNITGGGGTFTNSSCSDGLDAAGSAEINSSVNDTVSGAACGATGGTCGGNLSTAATQQDTMDDPYAYLTQPAPGQPGWPAGMGCYGGPYTINSNTVLRPSTRPDGSVGAGRYCSTLDISGNNTIRLCPGLYIFQQGARIRGGGALTMDVHQPVPPCPALPPPGNINNITNNALDPNERALFYITCPTSPCNGAVASDFRITGNRNLQLQGDSTRSDMLFWIDRTSGPQTTLEIEGGNNSYLAGRVYGLTAAVNLGGNSGTQTTLNMSIVADTVEFHGGATINMPFNPLLAPPIRSESLICDPTVPAVSCD